MADQLDEISDLCSIDHEIFVNTKFGREVYGVPDDFICLTSGENEAFILYSKKDKKIYEAGVEGMDALRNGEIKPVFESFYDLIEWYLGKRKDI